MTETQILDYLCGLYEDANTQDEGGCDTQDYMNMGYKQAIQTVIDKIVDSQKSMLFNQQFVILRQSGSCALLANVKEAPQRFIVASGLDTNTQTWGHATYFKELSDAEEDYLDEIRGVNEAETENAEETEETDTEMQEMACIAHVLKMMGIHVDSIHKVVLK